jgi:hypothetical protein
MGGYILAGYAQIELHYWDIGLIQDEGGSPTCQPHRLDILHPLIQVTK